SSWQCTSDASDPDASTTAGRRIGAGRGWIPSARRRLIGRVAGDVGCDGGSTDSEATRSRSRGRVGSSLPSVRGGKTPHAFSDDEREAAEHDRDVVVPAGKAPSFV